LWSGLWLIFQQLTPTHFIKEENQLYFLSHDAFFIPLRVGIWLAAGQ